MSEEQTFREFQALDDGPQLNERGKRTVARIVDKLLGKATEPGQVNIVEGDDQKALIDTITKRVLAEREPRTVPEAVDSWQATPQQAIDRQVARSIEQKQS